MPITKEDLENAKQDDTKRKADAKQAELKAKEKSDNEGPRKAVSDAVDYVKGKASKLGADVSKFAKEYGDVYKEGLGLKKDSRSSTDDAEQKRYTQSLETARKNEMKRRGITQKQFANEANKDIDLSDPSGTGDYKKGGKVKSASARADGCAIRGKTRA